MVETGAVVEAAETGQTVVYSATVEVTTLPYGQLVTVGAQLKMVDRMVV